VLATASRQQQARIRFRTIFLEREQHAENLILHVQNSGYAVIDVHAPASNCK
jgi:hypothetical protein